MKRLAQRLKAKYLLDFFHAKKYLTEAFLSAGKMFIKGNKAIFNEAISLFQEGLYVELLLLLKEKISNSKLLKKIFGYFKRN
jgi:hypothetical protein